MSAILQNPDILKNAFEDANNAAGSALRENEKYLDSIQGRIDLFNNAVQTMWSNALDSDVVKGFVNFGTQLVKIIDKVGLLTSILISLATISMIKNKMGPIAFLGGISDKIRELTTKLINLPKVISGTTTATNIASKAMKGLTVGTFQQSLATAGVTEANQTALLSQMGLTEANANHTIGQQTLTASVLETAVAEGVLTQAQALALAKTYGLTLGVQQLNVAQVAQALQTNGVARAQRIAIISSLGLTEQSKTLTAAQITETLAAQGVTGAQSQQILSALGLSVANKGLAASFTALWTAIWPILAIMAAVGLIYGIVKAVDALIVTTEELKEELDDLNSDISSIKSEIDSLNSELETTQDRMAELLAMDSLSFTDTEELESLKAQNAELERQIELNKNLLKNKEQERISKTKEVLDKTFYNKSYGKDDYAIDADGAIIHDDFWHVGMGGKKALDKGIAKYIQSKKSSEQYNEAYKAVLKSYNNGTLSEDDKNLKYLRTNTITTTFDDNSIETLLKKAEEKSQEKKDIVQKQESGISMVLGEMSDIIKENELSYTLDDEEINKFLDEYYAYSIKFQNAQGAASKSSVISAIFDQTANESIKNLKNELDGIADSGDDTATKITNAQSKIDMALADTTGQYQRLKTFMDTVGVSAQELAEYFVAASEAPDISTQEGVIQVYQDAIDIIGKYKKAEDEVLGKDEGGNDITWSNLFTQDDSGKWVADKLKVASILEGSDEDIRKEFTKIAEAVQNGEMTVEDATKKLDLSGARRVLDIEIKSLSEANLDIFPDLKEDINGIIDKFEELSKAVGGTVDALDTLKQARAEEAYSGSVSIETLENLMKYTDDYSKIVSVDETGAIRLATDAEDILIESRLEKIKQDANAALSEAELAYQEALHTQQTVTKTGPAQEVLQGVINQVGGAIAFVTSMWSDLTSGNWAGSWERAQQARASAIAKNESAYANKEAEANTSLAEAEANLKKAQDNAKIANSLTKDNVKTKYSSDAASGGASTPEDVAKNAFQKEMDYWENRIAANQAKYEQIQNEIDLLEKQGKKAGKEYYEEQIDLENGRLSLLEQQKQAAETYLGTLQEGSDEWWDAANTLNDIEGEIDDVTASVQDLSDAIAEIDLYVFEETHNRFKNLIDDLETIRDLIAQNGEEDWFDDEGMWTEKGVAVLGTYIQQYEMYKNALEGVNEELKKYQKEYAGNEAYYAQLGIDSEQELYNKQRELIDQQYEYAQAVNDTENSVKDAYEAQIDAIEEYCDELIDAYNDYIDVVKEALDAERDLYDFKKNIQKQTKDIASLERRIASLSGSDNAADIAERKKLESQLYDAKEGLNDTYYDHAKDQQSQALDDEAKAYEESLNNYTEKLRDTLDEATANMELFMQSVTNSVMINAEIVRKEYADTGVVLDEALVTPWDEAIEKIKNFEKDGLSMMNAWTTEEGFFGKFETNATEQLTSPWSAGTNAANAFKDDVKTAMENIVTDIRTNISTAKGQLADLYKDIKDTDTRLSTVGGNNTSNAGGTDKSGDNGDSDNTSPYIQGENVKLLQKFLNAGFGTGLNVDGIYGPATKEAVAKAQQEMKSSLGNWVAVNGKYDSDTISALKVYWGNKASKDRSRREWWDNWKEKLPAAMYAKGTTGTKKDQWAITDESWIGEEITLAAGKNGQLQYLKKGSAVMPADISANLIEWGKLNPNMMMGSNVIKPMIANVETKNQALNINFEALVKADNITNDVLPEVEKMVSKQLDTFTKKLNYAIKRL